MMPKPLPSLIVLLGLVAFSGCTSTSDRIGEKAVEFAQLSPTLQDAVRRGKVGEGFSREMTYMALGKPNTVVMSSDGRESNWTYFNYNTPDGQFVMQNKKAISSDIMGGNKAVLGIPLPKGNDAHVVGTIARDGGADNVDGGLGWRTVAGKSDLDRGEVAVPDSSIRQKTAMEMVTSDERQDLLITFYDGRIVAFRYVQI